MTARILITGSREWRDKEGMAFWIGGVWQKYNGDIVIVHGGARGADTMAEEIAAAHGIKTEVYPVSSTDWEAEPRRAGMIRNQVMVDTGPDMCMAFIRKASSGATGCLDMAMRAGIPSRRFEDHG